MYKDKKIILITNFKKSEKLFNFKIIHRINWGSIMWDPSFLFQNLRSYNINNQLAKFEKNLSVGSILVE